LPEGRALTLEEQAYIVVVIEHWLMHYLQAPDAGRQP